MSTRGVILLIATSSLLCGCQANRSMLAGDWYYQDGMLRGAGHRLPDGLWHVDVSIRFRPDGSIESVLDPLAGGEEVATSEHRVEWPRRIGEPSRTGPSESTGAVLWALYEPARTRLVLMSRYRPPRGQEPVLLDRREVIQPWGSSPIRVPSPPPGIEQGLLYKDFVVQPDGTAREFYEWRREPAHTDRAGDCYTLARQPPKVD